jgi:CheY-like chemotaxis protein
LKNLKILALGRKELTRWLENMLFFTGAEIVTNFESAGNAVQVKQAGYDLAVVDSQIQELENLIFKLIWYHRLRVIMIADDLTRDWSNFNLLGVDGYLSPTSERAEIVADLTAVAGRSKPLLPTLKALVIEDDPHIQQALKLCLRMFWPELVLSIANNGQSGMEMITTKAPDFVLLDLGLPDISGFDVLAQVRTFSQVPIITLTAQNEKEHIVRAIQAGANDYVIKPFSQIDLMLRIKKLVLPLLQKDVNPTCRSFF